MTELENEFPQMEDTGDEVNPAEIEIGSPTSYAEESEITEPISVNEESPAEDAEPETLPEPVDDPAADAETLVEAEPEAPKEESKIRRFFRSLLRWTLGLLIVLGIGFVTAVYLLYRPEVQNVRDLQGQLQSEKQMAGEQAAELEAQIDGLDAQIADLEPLATKNEELIAAQNEFELHIAILDARLDVSNALLALAIDDPARARVSLDRTGEALAKVSSLLPEDQREIVTALEQRLELVLSEMEDEPYAAQSDLDVLEKRLLEMEDALFGSQ
ncbi:MAG: hypothetical protein ISR58_07515 [Anaerolineales bacterium]|nr:hypothetical protein [Chloroflexota bacterium]MBL6981025.1 hypothetical protein [Anaerolineales bacterium]